MPLPFNTCEYLRIPHAKAVDTSTATCAHLLITWLSWAAIDPWQIASKNVAQSGSVWNFDLSNRCWNRHTDKKWQKYTNMTKISEQTNNGPKAAPLPFHSLLLELTFQVFAYLWVKSWLHMATHQTSFKSSSVMKITPEYCIICIIQLYYLYTEWCLTNYVRGDVKSADFYSTKSAIDLNLVTTWWVQTYDRPVL